MELVESENNLILHSGQSELSEYVQSLIADIGIYEVVSDKRLADRANLSVSAWFPIALYPLETFAKFYKKGYRGLALNAVERFIYPLSLIISTNVF